MRTSVLAISCFLTLSLFAQSNEKITSKKDLTTQERGLNKVIALEEVVGVLEPTIKVQVSKIYQSMYQDFLLGTDTYENRITYGTKVLSLLTQNQILKLKNYQEQRQKKYKDFLEEHPEHFWNRKSLGYDLTTL